MKKSVILIIAAFLLSGCFDFLPFYKYDSDPEPVYVHWSVTGGGTDWKINETGKWGNGGAEIFFDGNTFQANSVWSEGRAPAFGNLTAFGPLSPFQIMTGYLQSFLSGIDFSTPGISISTDISGTLVTYTAYTGEVGWSIPYEAEIDGFTFLDYLDPNQLSGSGTLAVVEFNTQSDDPFLQGQGLAVFHNGYPGGLLYFAFEHHSGYISLFHLNYSSSSQSVDYFGQLEADYKWYFFPY
ncbi:membrane lipoprotein lipid attachment site-containing protein [Spirochaeta isovalerica]|uniref:Lipoprotein n=1 Tax=Spirochaeta isovalerica TaxID=150 RepID=A0A841R6M6_9SPIO|nr:membrane lipoprotein lipid attachment site-containing protein [Spirochaeta isovalerica]MBB6479505.1 hypothetical protein [Spirochaeta isovalerica]